MIQLIICFLLAMSSIIKETVPPKFEILITEAKSDKGMIRILIFPGENGFPDQPQKALKNYSIRPKNRACEVVLTDLPAGNYAVTVIHDEDEDGKLNTNPVGYPTEKFGFSNNPKIYFSAPSFEKTKVSFGTNDKKILITLN